jgi:hypothetical protein
VGTDNAAPIDVVQFTALSLESGFLLSMTVTPFDYGYLQFLGDHMNEEDRIYLSRNKTEELSFYRFTISIQVLLLGELISNYRPAFVPVKIIAHRAREFEFVRDLTEAEISDHAKYTPIIGEARDRLKLFKILQKNYREWREYFS